LAVLSQARPWAMSSAEVLAALDESDALSVELGAARLRLIREADARGLAASEGASSTAVWLRNRYRMSIQSANRLVKTAAKVDAAPKALSDAVVSGAVNREQAEAILTTLARLPAEYHAEAALHLVEFSTDLDPAQLRFVGDRILHLVAPEVAEEADRKALEADEARAERERFFTMTPERAGNGVRLSGRLTAEGAAIVRAAIDPLCAPIAGDPRNAGQRRADALLDICRLALVTEKLPDNGGDRPQVVVTTDYDVLKQEIGYGTLDNGDRVTPETCRKLACDARLLPVVMSGPSQPLDVARTRRLISRALRKALVIRDRGCAFPGCDRDARWCDGHHVLGWWAGGPTALSNSVLVCPYHHSELHKRDGWTVYIAADGLPTFIPPTHVDPQQRPRRNRYHRRE
jgi:hypothetical protein